MPRSEASRAKDRARVKEWRKNNRVRANATNRKAWKKYSPKRSERHARLIWHASKNKPHQELPSVVNANELEHPRFTYIDRNGNIHTEKWESVEQLLQRLALENPSK